MMRQTLADEERAIAGASSEVVIVRHSKERTTKVKTNFKIKLFGYRNIEIRDC
jgi:hypothetical protein